MLKVWSVAIVLFGSGIAQAQFGGGRDMRQEPGLNLLERCKYTCSRQCDRIVKLVEQQIKEIDNECGAEGQYDQQLYKEIYSYASSSSGLWMSSEPARKFTEEFLTRRSARQKFEAFKLARSYAKSSKGLWLNDEPASAFAFMIIDQRNPEKSIQCYMDAYSYAKSSKGLWLSDEPARKHAEKICKIEVE